MDTNRQYVEFEYFLWDCEECGSGHDASFLYSIPADASPDEYEGYAYHDLTRACSPVDCDVRIRVLDNPDWNTRQWAERVD